MSTRIFLSAWRSGKRSGSTYGLRFGKLRDILFSERTDSIKLLLKGKAVFVANLSEAFWRDCPEVRHPKIREWILAQKLPWPHGEPPRFQVTKIGRNIFSVSRPNKRKSTTTQSQRKLTR